MSVWLTDAVCRALPERPRLHRMVHIEGDAYATGAGPTIDVVDPAVL